MSEDRLEPVKRDAPHPPTSGAASPPAGSLIRDAGDEDSARVGFIELFFDLVYVFAITQLTHHLAKHPDWAHAAQTGILFLAIWLTWNFTTWSINLLDPDRAMVRLMLGFAMLGSLIAAAAIPTAFTSNPIAFALPYVLVLIGGGLFMILALRKANPEGASNFKRATLWFLIAAGLWLWGADAPPAERYYWWGAAVFVQYLAPLLRFRFPGVGGARKTDWHLSGEHMAERCALFIIIALGEGIIVTGTTFADAGLDYESGLALAAAVVSSFAMWWVYFDIGAERGSEYIDQHDDPGNFARLAYTFGHIPIVAGIVLVAVSDEMSLADPLAPANAVYTLVITAGGLAFVLGTALFKKISGGKPKYPLSHLVGAVYFAALGLAGWLWKPQMLVFASAHAAGFIFIALWEWVSFHGGWLDRLERRGVALPARLTRRSRARLRELEGHDDEEAAAAPPSPATQR